MESIGVVEDGMVGSSSGISGEISGVALRNPEKSEPP
jgi:hypothetical protein